MATKHGDKKTVAQPRSGMHAVAPMRKSKEAVTLRQTGKTGSRGPGAAKDEVALKLAQAHFTIEPGISRIFRLVSDAEASDDEPIKLLEVNEDTTEAGIVPVRFGPNKQAGIPYTSIIVEIVPSEYMSLRQGDLTLPKGWRLGQEYKRTVVRRR